MSNRPAIWRPGITETTLVSAGICYSDYPEPGAIKIPYNTPEGDPTEYCRYRLKNVRPDGQKYHQEPNSGVHVYFPPQFFKHSANGKFGLGLRELILTEGEFKALALLQLGIYTWALPSFTVYTRDQDGHRQLLPELASGLAKEKIENIYFLGDSDTATNFEFARQAAFLARAAAPAKVLLPRIPLSRPKGIDDCKDALGADFNAFFTEVIRTAIPISVPKELDPSAIALLLLEREKEWIKALKGVEREHACNRIVRMCAAAHRLTRNQSTGRLCSLARAILQMNLKDFEAAIKAQQEEERKEYTAEAASAAAGGPRVDTELPIIFHPQNIYIGDFASALGKILAQKDFYQFNGRAVQVRNVTLKARNGAERQVKRLVELSTIQFSTLIEAYCRPIALNKKGDPRKKSISLEVAARTLVCLSFLDQLPEIKLWTDVRIPIRVGNDIILSLIGYDPASGVYTSPDAPQIDESLSIGSARSFWRELLSEFCFPLSGTDPEKREPEPERERCIAVALAAALTPFCIYLLPEKAKRPAFAASANAEGAGKTLLLSIGMVAKLGYVPIGSAPKDEEEMRKVLDGFVASGVPIGFFDNLKGHLNSGELEAFITASTRRYRILGTTNHSQSDNLTTIYLTANFATYSPDLRRRCLAIELILQQARAEDRQIKNYLDENILIQMRPKLLSVFWAFIRHWQGSDPAPQAKLLPSFEDWTRCVANIVQAAGFADPTQPSHLKTGGDTDTRDMETLISLMNPDADYKFADLVSIAQDHSLFRYLVPEQGEPERDKATRFGILLRKFVDRIFSVPLSSQCPDPNPTSTYKFCLNGLTQKTRRFSISKI